MISHRIEIDNLHSHHYRVTLTVPKPAAEQLLSLPVWIVGSYMVRDFARHLSAFSAQQGRVGLAVEPVDKSTWRVRCTGRGALRLRYRVYAFDTSVRAAFLDADRGFFNASSLCLQVQGQADLPQRLTLGRLPALWQVATSMPLEPTPAAAAAAMPPGAAAPAPGQVPAAAPAPGQIPAAAPVPGGLVYQAADYDELLDHPFELGRFWRGHFVAGGRPHDFVVAGALPAFDGQRLLADTRRICQQQIDFWHGAAAGAQAGAPFDQYVFLLNAVADGYGGLEHRASTALIAARRDLPRERLDPMAAGNGDGYITLLGLISHEYFHTWNVKRLKPAELARVDHQAENYTRLLWFFEGFTSYYDDLLLLRCGLIDAPRYLRLLAKAINAVAATPGRSVQSVAAASFDAWTKYYRPDENTPNATVSYYQKGALVALAFDLTLRQRGASLDDVMRRLWQRSGGGPITEADIAQALAQVAGRPMDDELRDWVHGTDELPMSTLLPAFGIELRPERSGLASALGLRLGEGPITGVQVKSVLAGSAASVAGLSAGDELLAVDGWRIRRLDDAQAWLQRDQPFELLLVRDQRVLVRRVRPNAGVAPGDALSLHLHDKPGRAAAGLRRAWLGA